MIPKDSDAERAVVTTVASMPSWAKHLQALRGEMFADTEARGAYESMLRLYLTGHDWLKELDLVTVEWTQMGQLLYTERSLEEAIRRVKEAHYCRQATLQAERVAKAAMQLDYPAVAKEISGMQAVSLSGSSRTATDVISDMIDEWGTEDARWVKTGFRDLDRKKVLKRREAFGIAARPSMGKSQLAFQIADNVTRMGGRTLIYSGEMHSTQVIDRIIGARLGYAKEDAWGHELLENEYFAQMASMGSLTDMEIIDTRMSTTEIWSEARRMKASGGIDLVVVDHLRLVADKRAEERHRLGQIIVGLKDMAKELDTALIICIQLSRAVENRDNKRPGLADLRDSGEIEEDLDVASFIYRQAYYDNENPNIDTNGQSGTVEYYARKNRNGKLWGGTPLYFHSKGPQFTDSERLG